MKFRSSSSPLIKFALREKRKTIEVHSESERSSGTFVVAEKCNCNELLWGK